MKYASKSAKNSISSNSVTGKVGCDKAQSEPEKVEVRQYIISETYP